MPLAIPDPSTPVLDDTNTPLAAVTDTSDAGTTPDVDLTTGLPDPVVDPETTETPTTDGSTDADPTNDPTSLAIPTPSLTVNKSVVSVTDVNGNGFTDAGDQVNYAFVVENTGNRDLINVEITDALPGIVLRR